MHFSLIFASIVFFDPNSYVKSLELTDIFKPLEFKEGSAAESSLVLIHVLFRHGNRTGQLNELYPKDPYINETYFPFGRGQLTNAGKVKEYSIGKALRERYGTFLGPYYYPQIIDAVSTDYNRTKMSLELVLASLFPPKGEEIWKFGLNWQPVPFNYLKRSEDKILIGVECPNYVKQYNELINSTKYKSNANKYREQFAYISQNTGLNVTTFHQVYELFFGLSTEEEWGFKLPDWTKQVWPQTITEIATKEYFVATETTDLKRMACGYFMKKVINDTTKIINNIEKNNGSKIFMYSAHESNIAELLIYLDVFEKPHVPTYGAYIVLEVHKIHGVYGFKIFYQNYTANKPKLLKLPACEEFCPLDKFMRLLEEYLPDDNLCGY